MAEIVQKKHEKGPGEPEVLMGSALPVSGLGLSLSRLFLAGLGSSMLVSQWKTGISPSPNEPPKDPPTGRGPNWENGTKLLAGNALVLSAYFVQKYLRTSSEGSAPLKDTEYSFAREAVKKFLPAFEYGVAFFRKKEDGGIPLSVMDSRDAEKKIGSSSQIRENEISIKNSGGPPDRRKVIPLARRPTENRDPRTRALDEETPSTEDERKNEARIVIATAVSQFLSGWSLEAYDSLRQFAGRHQTESLQLAAPNGWLKDAIVSLFSSREAWRGVDFEAAMRYFVPIASNLGLPENERTECLRSIIRSLLLKGEASALDNLLELLPLTNGPQSGSEYAPLNHPPIISTAIDLRESSEAFAQKLKDLVERTHFEPSSARLVTTFLDALSKASARLPSISGILFHEPLRDGINSRLLRDLESILGKMVTANPPQGDEITPLLGIMSRLNVPPDAPRRTTLKTLTTIIHPPRQDRGGGIPPQDRMREASRLLMGISINLSYFEFSAFQIDDLSRKYALVLSSPDFDRSRLDIMMSSLSSGDLLRDFKARVVQGAVERSFQRSDFQRVRELIRASRIPIDELRVQIENGLARNAPPTREQQVNEHREWLENQLKGVSKN